MPEDDLIRTRRGLAPGPEPPNVPVGALVHATRSNEHMGSTEMSLLGRP